MNLTYDNFHGSAEDCVNDHVLAVAAIREAQTAQAVNPGLGELGSLISKLLKFKKKITPKFLHPFIKQEEKNLEFIGKNAKFIAPIVSFVPVVGWVIGAAVTLVGADFARAKAQAANLQTIKDQGAALVPEYQKIAGQVPGRIITLDVLKQIGDAWFQAGGWGLDPNLHNAAVDTMVRTTREAVRRGIARGATTLADIYETDFKQVLSESPDEQWFVAHDQFQAQLIADFLDSAYAEQVPNSLPTYGVQTETTSPGVVVTATVPSAGASADWYKIGNEGETITLSVPRQVTYGANGKFVTKTLSGTVKLDNATFGDPIVGTIKAGYLLTSENPTTTAVDTTTGQTTTTTTSNVSADLNAQMLAAMQTLAAQGQSAESINASILTALNNAGTTVDDSQKAAISDAATKTASGQVVTAGTSLNTGTMLVLGAAALAFALARPAKRSRGKK